MWLVSLHGSNAFDKTLVEMTGTLPFVVPKIELRERDLLSCNPVRLNLTPLPQCIYVRVVSYGGRALLICCLYTCIIAKMYVYIPRSCKYMYMCIELLFG